MFIQKFVKGIANLTNYEAEEILLKSGILSNWIRYRGNIPVPDIRRKLTERNLDWHLNNYYQHDPRTGKPFHVETPFISTTAGTVERDAYFGRNETRSAFLTALNFATRDGRCDGHIFYGYLFTIGKMSIPLQAFSEEVRDLHVYMNFMPWHPEGEIVAKLFIPTVNLEKVELYSGSIPSPRSKSYKPAPMWTKTNPHYNPPENYHNIREVL